MVHSVLQVLQRHPTFADGSRIYNLDETSTTTVQRPQKVLAQKGRSSCKITSGERGTLVTTCCIVNASGQALPPAIVFPRKNFQQHMLHGAPPGTLGLAASSGWMNADIFTDVMKHFIKHSSASKDNPALLIIDNHESHLSIEALNLAKSSGVTILTLHPHTTAKMQPLDVGLHAPFKSFYNSAVDSWLMRNPGKKFTIYNVAECVGQAYLKSMTPINIVNAFKKCGIYPFDDNIFTDIDFMPSWVTDRPLPQPIDDETDLEEDEIVQKRADSPSILSINEPSVPKIISKENTKETTPSPSQIAVNRTPSPSTSPQKTSIASEKNIKTNFEQSTLSRPTSNMLPGSIFTEVIADNVGNVGNKLQSLISQNETNHNHKKNLEPKTPCSASKDSEKDIQKPSTSNMPISFISPKIFMPAIKASPRTGPSRRRLGRSIIATDTPEKNAIEERKQAKKKESKKRVNKVKQHLFKESKRRKNPVRKNSVISDDTDDDEFQASGSSSGGDGFISSEGEENNVLDDNFLSLSRDPREGEYVIVAFTSKKSKVYYVAKILEKIDDDNDCEFLVSYLKLKSKVQQKFIDPVDIETVGVSMQDIKYILPAPRFEGTSRRKTTLKFKLQFNETGFLDLIYFLL